jgi:hypothetical protein
MAAAAAALAVGRPARRPRCGQQGLAAAALLVALAFTLASSVDAVTILGVDCPTSTVDVAADQFPGFDVGGNVTADTSYVLSAAGDATYVLNATLSIADNVTVCIYRGTDAGVSKLALADDIDTHFLLAGVGSQLVLSGLTVLVRTRALLVWHVAMR